MVNVTPPIYFCKRNMREYETLFFVIFFVFINIFYNLNSQKEKHLIIFMLHDKIYVYFIYIKTKYQPLFCIIY